MVYLAYLISAAQWPRDMKGLCSTPWRSLPATERSQMMLQSKDCSPLQLQRGTAGLLIGSNQIILSNMASSGKGCSRWTHCSRGLLHSKFCYLKQWEGRNTARSEVLDVVLEPQDCWDMLHALEPQKWQPHHGTYLEGTLLVLSHLFCPAKQIFCRLQAGYLKYEACEGHQYLQ